MHLILRHLGLCDYTDIWRRMRAFTEARTATTPDEIWLLQHPPVFTHGTRGGPPPRAVQTAARATDIPLVHSDRGGQITYHAPGQLIAYLLLDLKRRKLGPKSLVARVEKLLIGLLAEYAVSAVRKPGAPGVYVQGEKIAALGFRIRGGGCYHGLSLNVQMDLTPYQRIDPCGHQGLAMTQLIAHAAAELTEVEARLARHLRARFGGEY